MHHIAIKAVNVRQTKSVELDGRPVHIVSYTVTKEVDGLCTVTLTLHATVDIETEQKG